MLNRMKSVVVIPVLAAVAVTAACGPGGTGDGSPSASLEPGASDGKTLMVSSIPMELRSVEVGSTFEVKEKVADPAATAKVTIERFGDRDGRPWIAVRAVFSNGDDFRFKVYRFLGGSSVASTFVGNRVSFALADVTDEGGKKVAKVGTHASGADTFNLAPGNQARRDALAKLKPGTSTYTFQMRQQLNKDGLNLTAKLLDENNGKSALVACGLGDGYTGLTGEFEMFANDSASIPGLGTCKLADYKQVRSAFLDSGSVTIEVNRPK
jgi:hypothetical protein